MKPDSDMIPDDWTLGQCVYKMSTGKRCQQKATRAVRYGSIFDPDPPAYGYCGSHALSVTRPRDPRLHRTAEPLTKVEVDRDGK